MEWAAALKYQRNEYAKRIRKQYEAGELQERRCNMREITTRDDGISNTLTTVLKDNYIIVACRGRYAGGVSQARDLSLVVILPIPLQLFRKTTSYWR